MKSSLPKRRPTLAQLKRNLHPSASGGQLRNFRGGRVARRISVRYSMHLVLRSLLARGLWSFASRGNRGLIDRILAKHALRTGTELTSSGNAGNHLHLRIKVSSKEQYYRFVRAVAGEIALKIKRISRKDLSPAQLAALLDKNFWATRPFSSIVSTFEYAIRLSDYIKINQVEGSGISRATARLAVKNWRSGKWRETEDDPPQGS